MWPSRQAGLNVPFVVLKNYWNKGTANKKKLEIISEEKKKENENEKFIK